MTTTTENPNYLVTTFGGFHRRFAPTLTEALEEAESLARETTLVAEISDTETGASMARVHPDGVIER